jgi:hypothetical protein
MFGSERNGFSPIMYMARTPPLRIEPMISVTVRPRSGSSSVPQASSKRARVSSRSTPW